MAPRLSSAAALALAALRPSAAASAAASSSGAVCSGAECSSALDDAAALLQSRLQTASAPRASGAALTEALAADSDVERLAAAGAAASVADTSRRHALVEELFAEVTEAGRYFDPFDASKREKLIDQTFENVKSNGKPILSAVRQRDRTWEMCTEVDWSTVMAKATDGGEGASIQSDALDKMVENLGLNMCFDKKDAHFQDATCAAVRAAIMSALTMSKAFAEGPIFANYSVVSWGKHPSWVNGSVSGLDYTKPLPIHAQLHNPNGVVGYAVCDILRTVLTQSANQEQSGSCSYVAPLAAVSHKAPAIAIKLAVRALWTGQLTPEITPCPKIFEQQPGLVPFLFGTAAKHHWVPEFFQGTDTASTCLGNLADCQIGKGQPNQNAGLTFMWSQSLISTWLRDNYGNCPDDVARAGLAYPGMSKADAGLVQSRSSGGPSTMFWECNKVIDPKGNSCKLVFNRNLCGDTPDEDCIKLLELIPDDGLREGTIPIDTRARGEAFAMGITDEAQMDKYADDAVMKYAKKVPRLSMYMDFAMKTSEKVGVQVADLMTTVRLISLPTFTDTLLQEVCSKHIAMLIIDDEPLKNYDDAKDLMQEGLPFFGNYEEDGKTMAKGKCNHAVYLEKCLPEENVYVIWSWGRTFNLTKEWLLGYPTAVIGDMDSIRSPNTFNTGMVCSSVVADAVTVS